MICHVFEMFIYICICFKYMIFLGLYNHEMIVYIVICIWYMIVLVMEIVFDTISEDVVQIWWNLCPMSDFCKSYMFSDWNWVSEQYCFVTDTDIRRLTSFTICKQRFIVFKILILIFWFTLYLIFMIGSWDMWYGLFCLCNMRRY